MSDKNDQQIIDFIQKFCDKHLEKKVEVVKKINKTFSDVGLSSIELVELLTLLEKKFHISIEATDLPVKDTIKSYVDLVNRIIKKSNG